MTFNKLLLDNSLDYSLKKTEEEIAKLNIQKDLMLKKALTGDNPEEIFKATSYLKGLQAQKKEEEKKSFIFDPFEVSANVGYKNDNFSIHPGILRSMSRTPYVRSVIGTRIDQIAEFLEPKSDSTSPGWIVRVKRKSYYDSEDMKPTSSEKKLIEECTEFLLNCGEVSTSQQRDRKWSNDTSLEQFVRKIMKDSLELDKLTAEVIETKGEDVAEFLAVDASTVFLADWDNSSKYTEAERKASMVNGFYPSHVQIINNEICSDYMPWEMMFGVRNPSTELSRNGYGYSELMSLIDVVTSLLNSHSYNSNFFKIGSSPKGILSVKGQIGQTALDDFKMQWQAEMSGVMNAHKLPVLRAEKAEWINTHVPNKDMEFNEFQQFLLRILCVVYKMSPKEVGLDSGGNNMFNNENTEDEISYSRNKGLKPLLKFLQRKINKWLVQRGKYKGLEFVFTGLEPDTEEREVELDIKKVQYLETYNTVAKRRGLPTTDWGDIPLNPIALQILSQKQQGGDESNDFMNNLFMDDYNEDEPNPFDKSSKNPMAKSFMKYLDWMKHKDA